MPRGVKLLQASAAVLICIALAACETSALAPRRTDVKPQERPVWIAQPAQPAAPAILPEPSRQSRDLARYYARVQEDLLVRGLLRTDGGGPDTAFTDTMLARNFDAIALSDEYERGAGLTPASSDFGPVKKWVKPIRMNTEFGPGIPAAQIETDSARVSRYAARLARVTGHPISVTDSAPNFHVLFVSTDDMDRVPLRIREIVPDVNPQALRVFDRLPRSIHCLVIAFSDQPDGYAYGTAIAVIRSEHPDLLRRSCIHEEIAQGLGLGNDDPRARPSIFNDDDEFALLTTHDELLLQILYNPRLRPGMAAETARPIVRQLAAELMGVLGPS